MASINTRNIHRSRTDTTGMKELPSPARITASVIVPTLAMDREPQVRWATPATQKQIQSSSFRLPTSSVNSSSIINGTKNIERTASTSLPDLPLNLQRTQSLSQS